MRKLGIRKVSYKCVRDRTHYNFETWSNYVYKNQHTAESLFKSVVIQLYSYSINDVIDR